MNRTVRVELGPRSYDVLIGPGMLKGLGSAAAAVGSARQAVVIADSNVAGLYGPAACGSLRGAGLAAEIIDFPAGEEHKVLATYEVLMDRLFALRPAIDRETIIVALGGGVAGDLSGFLAATALRGLRWLQCPTTLLADVDASVGGKTGIDHPAGKNLIGAFHQPRGVVIDVATLKTLPPRELRSGLAECVKHGMIRDASLLNFIEANTAAIVASDEAVMTELVARNVAIKAAVVSADERESGQRAHLNFGHTIGHGIESRLGLGTITHGEAVSLGMAAACHLAQRRGMIDLSVARRLEGLLSALDLPIRWDGLDPAGIWEIMQHDKKNRSGRVRMVLPTALGKVDIFDDITAEAVKEALAYLAKRN
ncbi:MAG: 3-dehydroquinate synthase [Phycisphaerae bacterium]|jgi:3-dehydroquinate synthase